MLPFTAFSICIQSFWSFERILFSFRSSFRIVCFSWFVLMFENLVTMNGFLMFLSFSLSFEGFDLGIGLSLSSSCLMSLTIKSNSSVSDSDSLSLSSSSLNSDHLVVTDFDGFLDFVFSFDDVALSSFDEITLSSFDEIAFSSFSGTFNFHSSVFFKFPSPVDIFLSLSLSPLASMPKS
jgi:hypothetical protein